MPLIIRLALQSDSDDILDFLRTDYYPEEPVRLSLDPRQPPPEEDEDFLLSYVQNGTCLIAEENTRIQDDFYSNQIIGVLIAGERYANETDHLMELANIVPNMKWKKILKLYAYIDTITNVFKRFNVSKAVHCQALAVSRNYRGKLIGNRMMQKFMEIAFKLGYQAFTLDCSSVYAIRICENLNMECLNTLAYSNYCDENGKQVFFPPEPHKVIKTFLQRL